MSYELVAERLVDEWRLANGSTVSDILQGWFDERMRICKTASERNEFAEARVLVAGATMDFVNSIAEAVGASVGSVMELLRNSGVVRFFSKLGWSFKRLWALLKKGHHSYKELRKVVAEYMAMTRVGRWTTDELRKFDEFLKSHPVATRVTGVVLGALLVFIWFNEAFIGDPEYDFDVSEIVDAIAGRFSFADIFGGPDGATRLITLTVGTAVSFPWPGPSSAYFVASIVVMLAHKLKTRLHPAKS